MRPLEVEFRLDDLSGSATRALVGRHLAGMYAVSPPENVHALGIESLRAPDISLWSGWIRGEIVGCGALRRIDPERGEIKSMRVADAWLRRGVGRAILEHIIVEARRMGLRRLWLETGTPASFVPARTLYESAGFAYCGPFEGYEDDGFSVFMTREV